MTQEDREVWKAGYDLHEKYQHRQMTVADWQEMGNDCRDLYERFKTPFGMHMSMMIMDLFMDLSQKKPDAQQVNMGV